PAAGPLRHGAGPGGALVGRGHCCGPPWLLFRVHACRLGRGAQPGLRRPPSGCRRQVRRQHPQGLCHLLVHCAVHRCLHPPLRLPRGPAVCPWRWAGHRCRLPLQPSPRCSQSHSFHLRLCLRALHPPAASGAAAATAAVFPPRRPQHGALSAKVAHQGEGFLAAGNEDAGLASIPLLALAQSGPDSLISISWGWGGGHTKPLVPTAPSPTQG
uniref:Uncharacterized protein n=1 Tax=Sus scrofa TaxID=9823 RepID=A0A8D1DF28_PIG